MIGVEDTIRAYRQSASSAEAVAVRCRNMNAAASAADKHTTAAALALGAVASDATRAVDGTIATASGQLRAIAGTLAAWAQAADTYADGARHLVAQAETRLREIELSRRTLATVEDEARAAPENALAYGYRQRALEQEIEQDYVALGTLLGRAHEEEMRLARALLEGHERLGKRPASEVRAIGARALELDPEGDAYLLWVLLELDADEWDIAGYDFVHLPLFFRDEDGSPVISSSDVSQGAFGDCWFIATLMAVADQTPGVIERMITYDPETGMYTVVLYGEDLQPHPIEVDGRLLLASDGNTFGAGRPEDKVLWPAIVEKALAEYWGGYPEIEGDYPSNAMRLITGSDDIHTDWFNPGPVEWVDGDDTNRDDLSATIDGGGIAVASTKKYPEGEHPHGLVGGHAYQVVDVTDGVVTLQNPWGTDKNDPIQLTWDDFHGLFQGVSWVN